MTPALLKYKQLKDQNPNTILLYRMGDFYEAFWEDAITISKVLDIALTSRDKTEKKTPMAGIPYHALDTYLSKLIDSGYKVAVAEQHEQKVLDQKSGKVKVIIDRNIAKIVTPSTYQRDTDDKSHFLVSITVDDPKRLIQSLNNTVKPNIALSCIDPNGSTFWVTNFESIHDLDNELFRINPSEILIDKTNIESLLISRFISKNIHLITEINSKNIVNNKLLQHLDIPSFKSIGINSEIEIKAIEYCFYYITTTQNSKLEHIKSIEKRNLSNRMLIDNNTLRNLEIVTPSSLGGVTLLQILDHTHTKGGKRKIKEWITTPSNNIDIINERINCIKFLNNSQNSETIDLLDKIYDLERVCAKLSYNSISPRDLVALSYSIEYASRINLNIDSNFGELPKNLLRIQNDINKSVKSLLVLKNKITSVLFDPAPANTKEGHFINNGISNELDELRQINSDSKKWLKNLEILEQQKTGIGTLKVKYNRVFGYFLEVSKSQISKVPSNYIRKQTTVNGERYITAELKEKESMILGANDKVLEIENEIFLSLIEESKNYIDDILCLQNTLSELDVYISFSTASLLNNYCEPIFKANNEFHAIDARHPVIEHLVRDNYIYNDIHLKNGEIILITGPNMGGKSTYIRMTALIAYMAHIGCYVPAKECSLCLIDSIFTRVGASDDISKGESTFMVEMTEAANILRNATENSLIILDEIGRGTSTYDGMSIAWSILNYIHDVIKAKTLFATHYHELTVLEEELLRLSNYTVGISEENGNVVFLRKIEKGKAEKSFGLHVAKIAGLPDKVLEKANQILKELENKAIKKEDHQFALWEFTEPVNQLKKPEEYKPEVKEMIDVLRKLDINNTSPIEALIILDKLRKLSI